MNGIFKAMDIKYKLVTSCGAYNILSENIQSPHSRVNKNSKEQRCVP